MTNPDMVKAEAPGEPGAVPEQSLSVMVPAPESDPALLTRLDPLDSPQPKPMINQHKSNGLKAAPGQSVAEG